MIKAISKRHVVDQALRSKTTELPAEELWEGGGSNWNDLIYG